jgi:GT2 family glycosyltransferase
MKTVKPVDRTKKVSDVPRLSVVVLSYNGMDHLPECLHTIHAQDFSDIEVIVVDNGSTDGSGAYISASWPSVRLIALKDNTGFCAGMNRGIEEARSDLVLLLNQDLSLEVNCFSELMKTWTHPPPDTLPADCPVMDRPVIGVFPKVMFYSVPRFINAFGADWYASCHWRDSRVGLPDIGAFDKDETVFGSIFPAVLFDRNKLVEIGAFDPVFISYCEDFDVCYRSNILGYRFVTCPEAVIRHKYRASSTDQTDPLRARFWFIRNYLLVFLKNYELKNLLRYGLSIFRRYLWNTMRHAIQTGNRAELVMCIRIIGSITKKMPGIIRSRYQIQKNRKFGDRCFWKTDSVEDYNIFHVDGSIVLSLKSMRAGKSGDKRQLQ